MVRPFFPTVLGYFG